MFYDCCECCCKDFDDDEFDLFDFEWCQLVESDECFY